MEEAQRGATSEGLLLLRSEYCGLVEWLGLLAPHVRRTLTRSGPMQDRKGPDMVPRRERARPLRAQARHRREEEWGGSRRASRMPSRGRPFCGLRVLLVLPPPRRQSPMTWNQGHLKFFRISTRHATLAKKIGPKPVSFKASLPSDQLVFWDELSIDLQWIDVEALLHVIDTATTFSSATFLSQYGQSVEGVWSALVECWCSLYTGFPTS